MINDTLHDYFQALERLKLGRPRIVERGSRISNDTVSLEAGRKTGSIKKSRQQFRELILAIHTAAEEQKKPRKEQADKIRKAKQTVESMQTKLDASLERELSLLAELLDTKKQLARLTGENVLPLQNEKVKK